MPDITYLELDEIISFDDFLFSLWYQHEAEILTPQLLALGYSNIKWYMGEADSFGPLTRYCTALNPEGDPVRLIYG